MFGRQTSTSICCARGRGVSSCMPSNSEAPGPRVYPAEQATQHCREGLRTRNPGSTLTKEEQEPGQARPSTRHAFRVFETFSMGRTPKIVKNASRYRYGCRPSTPFHPLRSLLSSIWGNRSYAPASVISPNSSPEDPDFPVLQSQKSLPDFTTDQLRCLISPGAGHLMLTLNNLTLMDNSMGQNPPSLRLRIER